MSSAATVWCKGCGGAIVPPGPRITFTGMSGEYHVACATSAYADHARENEREACAAIAAKHSEAAAAEIRSRSFDAINAAMAAATK